METFAGMPGMTGAAGSSPLVGLTGPETMADLSMTGGSQGKSGSTDPAKMMRMLQMMQQSKGTSAKPPDLSGASRAMQPGTAGMTALSGPPSFGNLIDRLVRYKGTV